MRNVLLGLGLSLSAIVIVACSGATSPPGPDSGESAGPSTAPDPSGAPSGSGTNKMCGGFGNLPCPKGLTCKDDPTDTCDPAAGGRDCSGICVPDPGGPAGNPACDRPERKYMSRDPNQCAVMRFFCEAGKVAFHDDCGCGCEPAP